jgi:hypothetical protein
MLRNVTKYLRPSQASHATSRIGSNAPSLPSDVRNHLGQILRAEYYERGDKPRFLGDAALPLEFDPYLDRIEQQERSLRALHIREEGTRAIAAALLDPRL